MKLLLYCTKAKPYLYYAQESRTLMEIDNSFEGYKTTNKNVDDTLNGKIVAECDFEVEEIFEDNLEDARDGYIEHFYTLKSYDDFDEGQKVLLKESCLQEHELSNYLGFENGYAIHIKNLHIFDKPKSITDLRKGLTKEEVAFSCIVPRDEEWIELGSSEEKLRLSYLVKKIENAPKNMGYCYYFNKSIQGWEKAMMLNVKPDELCRVLNDEQTIIVRKKVLKEMLNNGKNIL